MDYEENMAEQAEAATEEESFEDADLAEEEEDTSESLDSFTEEEAPTEEEQPKTQGTSEPGWFQKRWDKNVGKLTAQIRDEVRNEYEAQIAPLRERLLEMDAKELVKSGEFKSLDRAKEYLQLKQGITPQAESKPAEQPRNEKGQYAPKEDPATTERINMLAHQADTIKTRTGVDVMAEFSSNPEIKNKILSGEIDFYDVLDQMKSTPRRKPPAPARSSNGASGQSPNAIETMSKEQFARLEKKISEGARYSLK